MWLAEGFDVHFHELELLALTLTTEKGRGTVFNEAGLAFAQAGDIGGDKVLAADPLACCALFWKARLGASGTLANAGMDCNGKPRMVARRRRRGLGLGRGYLGKVEELVGGNTVKTVVHEGKLEHPCSGHGGISFKGCRRGRWEGGGVVRGSGVWSKGVLGGRVLVVVGGREQRCVASDDMGHGQRTGSWYRGSHLNGRLMSTFYLRDGHGLSHITPFSSPRCIQT